MPLFVTNMIIKSEEVQSPPPVVNRVPLSRSVSAPIPSKNIEKEDKVDFYHRVQDEKLEKLYNKKSPYLVDMVAIDSE